MYERQVTAAEARAAGFELADYEDDECEVWPENWRSVTFFSRLSTQWRSGMAGPTGLDYTAVLSLLRTLRLPRDEHDVLFDDVQVMERAALNEMAKPASHT